MFQTIATTTLLFFGAVVATSAANAAPLISEIFYDAVGSDNGKGFVEISAEPGTLLDAWTLELINGSGGAVATTLVLAGSVPTDRVFVVADQSADGISEVAGADQLLNFDLQNGPDSLLLRDAAGTLLDAVGFGEFDGGTVFAGEGSPAPDAPAGSSLARTLADQDSDDNAVDFAILDTPTPGIARFGGVAPPMPAPGPGPGPDSEMPETPGSPAIPIPEPSAALLLALGCVFLGQGGRRGEAAV